MIVPAIYMDPKSMIFQDNLQGAPMGYFKGNWTSGGWEKQDLTNTWKYSGSIIEMLLNKF